jgi:RecA/RadA recombinase
MPKKPLKKKQSDFSSIRKKFSSSDKYKEQKYFDLGEAFHKACGIPGPAIGQINMLLGHSDTGKTTALIKTAVDAQKKGILPVFIITEQKFSFEHAKQMGLETNYIEEVDEDTGEINAFWDGFLLYRLGFDYIEQAFEYMTEILDAQKKGEIPHDIVFLWDSIGTIPCEMSFNGKGGNQHTARVISEKWGMGMAQRITSSRKVTSEYTNTAVFVNQPWVEIPEGFGQKPRIQPKGGQSIYLSCGLVFLFGNQKSAGVSKLQATNKGRKVNFAIRTKVGIHKNHMNGLGYADCRILATTHGFIEDDKKHIDAYKDENKQYWSEVFEQVGQDVDFDIVEEDVIDSPVDYSDD